jgi:hypothetical protein
MATTARTRRSAQVLRVDVRDLDGNSLSRATVTLESHGTGRRRGRRPAGKRLTLAFDKSTRAFVASSLDPGTYRLAVQHAGLAPDSRDVQVHPGGSEELVILGRPGLPTYYRGRVRVPFDVDPKLVGVTYRRGSADDEGRAATARLAKAFRLGVEDTPNLARRARMQLFRLPSGSARATRELLERIQKDPAVEYVGILVSWRKEGFTQLTDEAVVACKSHVTENAAVALFREFGFSLIRVIPYSANTFHLRWRGPGTLDLLGALDKLAAHPDIAWAEPNVYQSPELDAITPPDVLWQGCWDRQLIGCPDAWQHLQDAGLDAYGDPDVIIAVVDSGTQSSGGAPTNPDFQGTVTSGAAKVYQAFDFGNMVANNDAPWDNHGSGVAGVVSGRASNAAAVAGQFDGVAGAAPNCRLITIAHAGPETTTADTYIWAAGFNPNSPLAGFPAQIALRHGQGHARLRDDVRPGR